MPFAKRLTTLLKSAAAGVLLILLASCGGTNHVTQTDGATGVVLKRGKLYGAMPDGKGGIKPGKIDVLPGALIHLPKTTQEVVKELEDQGVKIEKPK